MVGPLLLQFNRNLILKLSVSRLDRLHFRPLREPASDPSSKSLHESVSFRCNTGSGCPFGETTETLVRDSDVLVFVAKSRMGSKRLLPDQ